MPPRETPPRVSRAAAEHRERGIGQLNRVGGGVVDADGDVAWTELQHRATDVAAIDGGVRMTFPAAMYDEVEDLAQRESACCSFLTLATVVEADVLTLQVTSANPDGLAVISMLAGIPLP